jgi:hypothetical protein
MLSTSCESARTTVQLDVCRGLVAGLYQREVPVESRSTMIASATWANLRFAKTLQSRPPLRPQGGWAFQGRTRMR